VLCVLIQNELQMGFRPGTEQYYPFTRTPYRYTLDTDILASRLAGENNSSHFIEVDGLRDKGVTVRTYDWHHRCCQRKQRNRDELRMIDQDWLKALRFELGEGYRLDSVDVGGTNAALKIVCPDGYAFCLRLPGNCLNLLVTSMRFQTGSYPARSTMLIASTGSLGIC
jgi:hypothetical protein